jgi:transcriptional regulator with XRE-family HTH domain
MEMPEVLRQRRTELGLSQADLAAAVGIDMRQIRRYEAGQQQPALSVAVRIADALDISIADLVGKPIGRVDLTGNWWTAWQNVTDDSTTTVSIQQVRFRQAGRHIDVATNTPEEQDNGVHWRGELRLWDYEFLTGWYAGDDGAAWSRGTIYLVLRAQATHLDGRWVSINIFGDIITGWIAAARTENDAATLVQKLVGGSTH